jgi:nitrogen-specific signal transduction histidine kinase
MTANDGSGSPAKRTAAPSPRAEPSSRDDALRRAVRLDVVQELADEMAHDLNNVLTVIAGSLQLFLMQQGGETAQHHFVRNAIEAAMRGAQMTGNLLAYASPQVVEVGVIDTAAIVQGVAPLLRETLGAAMVLQIAPQPGPGTPAGRLMAVGDRRYLESALLAVCQLAAANVSKSAGPGRMSIRCGGVSGREAGHRSGAVSGDRDCVEVSVRCEAAGISSELIGRALTPSFSAVPANRPALDLGAAYASIRQCQGDIGVEPIDAFGGDGFIVSILLSAAQIVGDS